MSLYDASEHLLSPSSLVGQLFSCGSVAQAVLSRNTLGEPLTVHIGFSVGLMMAEYVAGGVSGKLDWIQSIVIAQSATKCILCI